MFHSPGVSVVSSPLRDLNWFVFLLILSGSKLGTRLIQTSALFTVLPNPLQIIFCVMRRALIMG